MLMLKAERRRIARAAGADGRTVRAAAILEDLDVLRRRLARGQRADHGRAHARRLARLDGVRRRARLRGRDARSRPALRARERVGARTFCCKPLVSVDDWIGAGARRACKRFDRNAELYIRPMYWAETGAPGGVRHDPDSTRWCLCIYEAPLPKPAGGAITLSPYPPADRRMRAGRRQGRLPLSQQCARADRGAGPRLRQLPDARHARQHRRARHRQHLHGQGRRGLHAGGQRHLPQRHHPPARHRAAARGRRHAWSRQTLSYADFESADEIFSTGNYSKVSPVTRIDDRELQPGPFYRRRARSTGPSRTAEA